MTSVGRFGANRTDAVLALAFTVVALVQVTIWPIADGAVGYLYVLGTTLPLAWRRTHPVVSTLAATPFWWIPTEGFPVLGFVVLVLQFFALGSHGRPRWAVAAVTVWSLVASVTSTLLGPEHPAAAIGAALVVVAPVLAGELVAHLARQNAELARLAERLREERERAEEAAIGAERARIAQELHDVVGHEVTLIAVQAEAASAALRLAPERAAEPVEAIRSTAHRTLAEIRGVLGLLAEEEVGTATEELAEVARRAEDAGIPNQLVVAGAPDRCPEQVRLAANRVVRECLTNAGRHAPGETLLISVEWRPGEVRIQADNATDGGTPVPGRGLTGMRHRAELLGGTFDAGVHGGRFAVRVVIPW